MTVKMKLLSVTHAVGSQILQMEADKGSQADAVRASRNASLRVEIYDETAYAGLKPGAVVTLEIKPAE